MTVNPLISVIIPVLNEESIIGATISEIDQWFVDNMPDEQYEIVVVNDGSTDRTADILDDLATKYNHIIAVHHPRNLGRGRGVRNGVAAAKGEFVVTLDADLSYAPDHIRLLVEPLREKKADITLASAYHPDGIVENVPFGRAWVSRMGNKVLSLSDYNEFSTYTCIVRGFRRCVFEDMELISDGKELHLEILQKAALFNYRVLEIPAHLRWRDNKRKARTATPKKKNFSLIPGRNSVVASHLTYSFCSRPNLLVLGPALMLTLIILIGMFLLGSQFFDRLLVSDLTLLSASYHALRSTLIDGYLTCFIILGAAIFLFQFMAFLLLSAQNKNTYQELVVYSRLLAKLIRESRESGDAGVSEQTGER